MSETCHRLDALRPGRPAARDQPEAGFFGIAPCTSAATNLNAIRMLSGGTIFTNVTRTGDGDVWWEGRTGQPPAHPDRLAGPELDRNRAGRPPTPAPASSCPPRNARRFPPEWEDPARVPIAAILCPQAVPLNPPNTAAWQALSAGIGGRMILRSGQHAVGGPIGRPGSGGAA